MGRFAIFKFKTCPLRNSEAQNELSMWGLSFENKLLSLNGRVLPAERILQGARTVRRGDKCRAENRTRVWYWYLCVCVQYAYNPWAADWSKEMRGVPLISAMPLESWLLFYTRRNADVAHSLLQTLHKAAGPMGIRMQKPCMWVVHVEARDFSGLVKKKKKKPNVTLFYTSFFFFEQDRVWRPTGSATESPSAERSTRGSDGKLLDTMANVVDMLPLQYKGQGSIPRSGSSWCVHVLFLVLPWEHHFPPRIQKHADS